MLPVEATGQYIKSVWCLDALRSAKCACRSFTLIYKISLKYFYAELLLPDIRIGEF